MDIFLRGIDAISEWSGKLASLLVWPMMFAIAYEIIARYFFSVPTVWASETVTYLCGIYGVVGGAYTLKLSGHVNVDIFYGLFRPRAKAVCDLVTSLLFFVYFSVIFWTGLDLSLDSVEIRETSGTAWSPPIYPIKLLIPITAILIILQGLAGFIRNLKVALPKKDGE